MDLGAGPCGTLAREREPASSPLAWVILHLVPPLQAYYAAKARIRDPRAGVSLGAKHGGGNGQPVRC